MTTRYRALSVWLSDMETELSLHLYEFNEVAKTPQFGRMAPFMSCRMIHFCRSSTNRHLAPFFLVEVNDHKRLFVPVITAKRLTKSRDLWVSHVCGKHQKEI